MPAVKTFAHLLTGSFLILALAGLTACSSTPESSRGTQNTQAAEINTQLGLAYLNEGMPDVARIKFEKALSQNPRSPNVQTGLGMFNEYLGDLTSAEEHFLRAQDLAQRSGNGSGAESNNLARFYCKHERYGDADRFFQLAFTDKYYTRKEVTYTNAAICTRSQQLDEKAADYLRTALQFNKDYAPALHQMAKLSFDQGIYPLAQTYLVRYQETSGEMNAELLWLAYQIESMTGGSKEAMQRYANDLKTRFPDSEQTAKLYRLEMTGGKE